jgi:hypothetical protein
MLYHEVSRSYYAVHRDYSSPGRTGSTSTTPCGVTTSRPDCTSSTAPMLCIRTRRLAARLLVGRSHWLSPCARSLSLVARLLVIRIAPALLRICCASGRAVSPLDLSSVGRTGSCHAPGHCVSWRDYSSSGLHQLYCAYAVHPDASSCRSTSCRSVALGLAVRPVIASRTVTTRRSDCTSSTAHMLCIRTRRLTARLLVGRSHWLSPCVRSLRFAARLLVARIAPALLRLCRASERVVSTLNFSSVGALALVVCPVIPLCVVTTRLAAATDILRLRRTFRCFGTSRGSSHGSSHRSLSTTSPTPRVRVPQHVARLITWLVVDYINYAARPGASARCAARRAVRRQLRLRRASGCLGMSRSSLRRSSSNTSPTSCIRVPWHVARLVVDFFAYAVRPGASARRAACYRLLHLRRASGCLGTSRGSSLTTSPRAGSSSTTSPTPRVRVPRHITRLVSPLVIDYFSYAARPGALTRRAAHHAACRRLLRAPRLRLAATLALLQPRRAS